MINKELEFCELIKVWSVLLPLCVSDPRAQILKGQSLDYTIS